MNVIRNVLSMWPTKNLYEKLELLLLLFGIRKVEEAEDAGGAARGWSGTLKGKNEELKCVQRKMKMEKMYIIPHYTFELYT